MPRLDHARSTIHLAADELAELERRLAQLVALLDRDVVLHETVRLLTDEFGLHGAWIAERDGLGDGVLIRHTSGSRTEHFRGVLLRSGCGLGGKVFALGGVEWVDDYLGSAAITHDYDGQVAQASIRRMIAAPISSEGATVGVLLGGLRDGGTFGNRAATVVKTVAERTAQALLAAERARRLAELAVQDERQRMALELHDTVGAMLFAITAGVRSASEAPMDAALRERLRAIERQASDAATTLRESLRALRTPPEQLALGAALRAVCRGFEERTGRCAELVMLDLIVVLSDGRVKALIAAAREGLLNVEKHAQAARVVVTVAGMHEGVAVTVSDDGAGFPGGAERPVQRGFGLDAIADVLARVGGRLHLSGDEGGVTLRAWVPA